VRVIDAAEISALFQTWSNGPAPLPQELEAAAQFIKGPPVLGAAVAIPRRQC
jgi:hypothetical protein